MNNIQTLSDRAAISLSLLCTLHCIVFPWAVVLIPSLAVLPLEDEFFHLWMVVAVIPISAFALTMGCKKHKRHRVLLMGSIGLCILISTVLIGHETLGEAWEKILTVIGASIIALGHLWNFRLCRHHDNCGCPGHNCHDAK